MKSSPIVSTIKRVMPTVVSIVISKHLEDLEKELAVGTFPFLPHRGKLPPDIADAHGMVKVGGGSGFIVDSSGIILTNKHVITDPTAEYAVLTDGGEKYTAEILARDPINDVAILKINAGKLPIATLGISAGVELGQTVIAIGNALGIFKNTVSLGIISGLSRYIQAQMEPDAPPHEMRGLIQTDAAINPGNSGGPLVNEAGEAIGINAAIVFGAQNIGFAIPIDAAKRDLSDLKKYGKIRRPLLGVRYLSVNEMLQQKLQLPVEYGALIVSEGPHDLGVVPGSPADDAGLEERDLILEFDGKKITKDFTIQDGLQEKKVGDTVTLTIIRKGKEKTARVVLKERK